MNGFINCQGFAKMGMLTVLIGAVLNIRLDPVFIFVFHMGVKGAAVATVNSQMVSARWVVWFLTGKKTLLSLKFSAMKPDFACMREILALGLSGFIMAATNCGVQVVCNVFIMAATNCGVQVVCNVTLQSYGGDVYVGIMTIVNSVREVLSVPASGLTQGTQPILGFNYGAGKYRRVKSGIKIMSVICMVYTTIAWVITLLIPQVFITMFNGGEELMALGVPRVKSGIKIMSVICMVYTTIAWVITLLIPQVFITMFNGGEELMALGVPAMRIYFFGFCFMSLQFAGQSVFTGLGKAKQAIFFSLLRKAVIVIPLTAMRIYFFGFCFMSLQFAGQSVFTGLGKAKQAIFFSLLRKAVIVIPLTLWLPAIAGLGAKGVFLAEPISNFIGGTACFVTMLCVIWPALSKPAQASL